jgi:hypothetical protein
LKRKPGEKPFRQRWADYKKEEKALDEARYARLRPRKKSAFAVCAVEISKRRE